MRKVTKEFGKFLYRDGPMLFVCSLFVGICYQNYGRVFVM